MLAVGAVLWTVALLSAVQSPQSAVPPNPPPPEPTALILGLPTTPWLVRSATIGGQDAQQADAPQSAIVSGRVLDADTGRPIPGALVTAYGAAAAGVAARMLTNQGGFFVVRGLRRGSLALTAVKSGYVDAGYGQQRPSGGLQMIAIDEGQRLADLDIRMWKQGAIAGTLVDETGDPVIGARVRAFQQIFVAARRRFTPSGDATTDDRGVYRIPHLTPGDYIVAAPSTQTSIPAEIMDTFFARTGTDAARADLALEMRSIDAPIVPAGSEYALAVGGIAMTLPPGTATPISRPSGGLLVYPTVFYPAAAVAAQAAVISLRSGEERGSIDLQLQPSRSVTISGMLGAPAGMASHVAVRLLPIGGEALGEDIETATAVTDSTGTFTFLGVPPGNYALSILRVPRLPQPPDDGSKITVQTGGVRISTSAPPPGPVPPAPIPPDATLWAQVPLAVGTEDITNIVVPLSPGARMTGRVEFDGAAPPPPPSVVASLLISLDPADGSAPPKGIDYDAGHPDETGQFTTYGVPPARYVVNITGPRIPGWFFKGARYQGRDIADTPVEMSKSDVTGVVLTFTDNPSTLSGTVRTNGSADPAGIVVAFPVDEDVWSSSGSRPRRLRTARADKNGMYAFPNLPAGDYYVTAVKDDMPGDLWDPARLRSLSHAARQVHLSDGEHVRQDLETGARR